jgi:hypothetical protein
MLLAHAGHWATAIALGFPPLAILTWLIIVTIRDKRRARRNR